MNILANLFGWIARHALVFVLLVAAMAIYGQYRTAADASHTLAASIDRIHGAQTDLKATIETLRTTAVTTLDDTPRISINTINTRIRTAITQRTALQNRRTTGINLLTAPRDAITSDIRRDFDIEILTQEITFLTQLRNNIATRGRALTLDAEIKDLDRRIAADAATIASLPSRMSPSRYIRCGLQLCDLANVYAERQATNSARRATLAAARKNLGKITALATPKVVIAALERHLNPLAVTAGAQGEALEANAQREAERWYARLGIGNLFIPALWALIAIILTPFAIRTVFYWVLAPLASLQKPIHLLDSAAVIPLPTDRSFVSRAITPGSGHELLVKQGFIQTVSHGGTKATQLLLDSNHPLTSIIAGLWFLTRIRGGPGDTTTVSAIQDPFAEIAMLSLPAGAAVVLQPRAIAGVVQPIAAPLKITSHWRLGTLNAWLTWQLRFLVFHGPAQILLTGGRGVRIEAALAGRSIGQDQLIGFSAGLAYSTGRTETFLPYLLGHEPLLKDRVAAGSGVLIAEEAPGAGRPKSGIRHGLEGATDAILKVFGI